MNLHNRVRPGLYSGATLLVLGYFAWFLCSRALNIPYHDDIIDVLQFVLQFDAAQNLWDRLQVLLQPHYDHRTAASRLIFYLSYLLTGEISFRRLSLLANLAIPAFVLLYALSVPVRALRWPGLLLAALILCQPQAYGLLFWSMSAFAFYAVSLYALAALYCIHRGGAIGLLPALLFAVGSNLSLASGQLVWLAGGVLLVWQWLCSGQRPRSHLLVWLLAAAVCLMLYGFGAPPRYQEMGLPGTLGDAPLHHSAWYLTALGGSLGFSEVAMALPAGALLLLSTLYLIGRGLREDFGAIHAFMLFLLGHVALVTLGRASLIPGLDYALAPRYSVASQLLLLGNLLLWLCRWRGPPQLLFAVLVSAALLCAGKYCFYTPLLAAHLSYRVDEFNQGRYWVIGYPLRDTNSIVEEAVRKGIYRPPLRPLKVGPE